jgi:hypothetical protein
VVQIIIRDYLKQVGGVLKEPITNKLLISVASARTKYEAYLILSSSRERKNLYLFNRKEKEKLGDE